jgi:hypothetical protein
MAFDVATYLISMLWVLLELLNLLINPVSHDFALRWHRDDIPEDASAEDEQKALKNWQYGVRIIMNCWGLQIGANRR